MVKKDPPQCNWLHLITKIGQDKPEDFPEFLNENGSQDALTELDSNGVLVDFSWGKDDDGDEAREITPP